MRSILLAVVFLAGMGCRAHMVSQPGSGMAYGPVNESSRPGTIRYLNRGLPAVREARRQDAYQQMYSACRGYYRIDGEGPQATGYTTIQATNYGATAHTSEWWVIQYSCVPPPPAYPPPATYPQPAAYSPQHGQPGSGVPPSGQGHPSAPSPPVASPNVP